MCLEEADNVLLLDVGDGTGNCRHVREVRFRVLLASHVEASHPGLGDRDHRVVADQLLGTATHVALVHDALGSHTHIPAVVSWNRRLY